MIFQFKVLLSIALDECNQSTFEEEASTKRVIVTDAVIDKACKDQSCRTVAVSIWNSKGFKSNLSIIIREIFLPPLAWKSRDID